LKLLAVGRRWHFLIGRYWLVEHPEFEYGRTFNASIPGAMAALQAVGMLKPGYVIPTNPPESTPQQAV
jgi:hypothetical protein